VQVQPGSNLGTLMAGAATGLPAAQVSQFATAVAGALDHGHGQGLLHGDVRPSTIEIGPHGQAVLGDVGIGALDPTYAAPERLRGAQVDGRSDQYSLACTMFRLLTGRDPYQGTDSAAVAAAHLGQPVPSARAVNPFLVPQLDEVLGHAMAKDPQHRYASCGAFAGALAASIAPAPPHHAPRPSRRRGWWIAAAVTAVVAVVATVVVVTANGGPGSGGAGDAALTWDDTLYPQEIPSMYREPTSEDELQSVIGTPTPTWTTPMTGGTPDVVGGDDRIITLRSGTYLIGLDADTGTASWPAIDLGESPMSCAVHGNRIGCVAPPANGADSSVFILDTGSGKLLKTVKVPNQDLRRIVVAGDRLVVATETGDGDGAGFAAGYTTEGDEVWTHKGAEELYLVPGQHILVDGSYMGDKVAFHNTDDGRKVVSASRVRDERDLTWNVFHGGIAVQNADWTGTDIYDLDGKKVSSVAGWEPAAYQNVYAPGSTLPVLTRIKESHYRDDHTLAVANPKTGHLMWRADGQELTAQMITVNDKLIVKIADPDAPTGADGSPEPTSKEFVRVYDVYSGDVLSPAIDMTGTVSVEIYWLESDGTHILYNYVEETGGYLEVAYDIESGDKAWEIPMVGHPAYPGGALVAATEENAISLFR
jgi:hypothetical protein